MRASPTGASPAGNSGAPAAVPRRARDRGSRVGSEVVTMPRPGPGAPSSAPGSSACPQCHGVAEGLRRGACNPAGASAASLHVPGDADACPPPRDAGTPRAAAHITQSPANGPADRRPSSPALRVASGWTGHGEATPEQLPPRATPRGRPRGPAAPGPSPAAPTRAHARARRAPPDPYFPLIRSRVRPRILMRSC